MGTKYVFCGYCGYHGTFTDGDKAGQPWNAAKVLLGKNPDSYGRCTSATTVKASSSFSPPSSGTVGTAFFDEYGRIISFVADDKEK